jgi:hypothetical protein
MSAWRRRFRATWLALLFGFQGAHAASPLRDGDIIFVNLSR